MSEDAAPKAAEKLVLIVDDDESIIDLMEHVVRKEGFRTDRATDGKEALTKAQALKPDLILLDFLLPSMDGHAVVRALRESGHGGIPVIAVTGQHLDEARQDALRREPAVKDFLQKPLRTAVLAAAVRKVLGAKTGA
ncbi:MAG TPA: response regulator [Elusimicrobiota bacterium]|nr:response regulator [Elusimicrobiota bacterium]